MTKDEAKLIPELQIHPDGLVEDCFYYRLAQLGRLSDEQGRKALDRLHGCEHDPCYTGSFIVADLMIHNLDIYGIPCMDWAD